MNRSILCARGVIVLALLAGGAAAEGNKPDRDLASRIVEMTGARTKIVWQHQATVEPGSGWDATTPQYELMGFDTDEGKARVILPGPASYANCCIAPDGN